MRLSPLFIKSENSNENFEQDIVYYEHYLDEDPDGNKKATSYKIKTISDLKGLKISALELEDAYHHDDFDYTYYF